MIVLNKPYTGHQRADFIVEHNHKNNKKIYETEKALYALEPWEELIGDTVVEDMEKYKQEEAQKERDTKKAQILKELEDLDKKSIRAIRANDLEYISKYEEEAEKLRKQLTEI